MSTTERVITVEYLRPTMCRDLLGKFPDESAFGFDYSQSGLWSPPIIRRAPVGKHEIVIASCNHAKRSGDDLLRLFREGSDSGFDYSKSGLWSPPIIRRAPADGKDLGDKLSKIEGKIKKKKRRSKNAKIAVDEGKPDRFAAKQGWGKVLRAATRRLKKPEMSEKASIAARW